MDFVACFNSKLTVMVRFWTQCEWSKNVVGSEQKMTSVEPPPCLETWQNLVETEMIENGVIQAQ